MSLKARRCKMETKAETGCGMCKRHRFAPAVSAQDQKSFAVNRLRSRTKTCSRVLWRRVASKPICIFEECCSCLLSSDLLATQPASRHGTEDRSGQVLRHLRGWDMFEPLCRCDALSRSRWRNTCCRAPFVPPQPAKGTCCGTVWRSRLSTTSASC